MFKGTVNIIQDVMFKGTVNIIQDIMSKGTKHNSRRNV